MMKPKYINRELSWLDFNLRVLNQATLTQTPLFEKLRFISIFNSNLDEFYMVRVGSLMDLQTYDNKQVDSETGWSAKKQLEEIGKKTQKLLSYHDTVYKKVLNDFKDLGYHQVNLNKVSKNDLKFINPWYQQQIRPLLNPQLYNTRQPFPQLINKQSYVFVALEDEQHQTVYGFIPIINMLPNALIYHQKNSYFFIRCEDIICYFLSELFPNYRVVEHVVLRMTRNADLDIETLIDNHDEPFQKAVEKMLKKRQRLAPVRLQLSNKVNPTFHDFLNQHIKVSKHHIFISSSPFDYGFIDVIKNQLHADKQSELFYPFHHPVLSANIQSNQPLIHQLLKRDLLLMYPYHSFNTIIDLLKEAAYNPNVFSIKITLYRLAPHSKIIDALIDAAQEGKEVIVYLELRARFDESNNLHWSNKLESSLVRVVYGFQHYKIHSKALLISLKDKHKVRHITHIGTGNYNEQTAKLYGDMNLLTSNIAITDDVVDFFSKLALGSLDFNSQQLFIAPTSLKKQILNQIQKEVDLHEIYNCGYIILKMNSLTDKDIIDALAFAGSIGVEIHLIVRGICCLTATDNIHIYSVIGRFLEHARIYYFRARGDHQLYIASADLMTRNTEKRVEIAAPIHNKVYKTQLIDFLHYQIRNPHTYQMNQEGHYRISDSSSSKPDSQEQMIHFIHQEKNLLPKTRWQQIQSFLFRFKKVK